MCKRVTGDIIGGGGRPRLRAEWADLASCAERGRTRLAAGQGACTELGLGLSIPNLITLGRIILVPAVIWAIISGEMLVAFTLFLAAGLSDAVDGFIAKRFHMASELGAYLDPLADKALIVSIYVALGIARELPISLVILVVSRDIMIISGFMLAWLVNKPMQVRPHPVSKLNTVMQILLAALVLAEKGMVFDAAPVETIGIALVAILTVLSIAFYLAEWFRHMNSFAAGH